MIVTVSVFSLPLTQMQHMCGLQNKQFFRTKYMAELTLSSLFALHRHATFTLVTTSTYKATFIQKKKETCWDTHMHLCTYRDTHSSHYTHTTSPVTVYPSILTFRSVRATVTIHLSSHSPTSAAKQLSG